MQLLNVLLKFAPIIVQVAQQGQAAWEKWIAARAVEGGVELSAAFAELRSENVRMLILAEHEAGLE